MNMRHLIDLVETPVPTPLRDFRVTYAFKSDRYVAMVGNYYTVQAHDEAGAKRQVRKLLHERFPMTFHPWRILYAFEVPAAQ